MSDSPKFDSVGDRADNGPVLTDFMVIPSVLGVLVACAATVAISHDVAFFLVIGIDFINVLTTADLIKSTANWLVPILIPLAIWIAWEAKSPSYSPYISNYLEQGLVSGNSLRSYWRVFNNNKFFSIISLLTPINFIFFQSWYAGIITIAAVAFLLYCGRKLRKSMVGGNVNKAHLPILWSVMALLTLGSLGFAAGFVEGEGALNKTTPVYQIKAADLDRSLSVMIRNSEKGVLIKQENKFIFVPWDNIKFVAAVAKSYDDRSIASRIYHWWIDQPLSPP